MWQKELVFPGHPRAVRISSGSVPLTAKKKFLASKAAWMLSRLPGKEISSTKGLESSRDDWSADSSPAVGEKSRRSCPALQEATGNLP